ncbi:MAG: hypothetical protein ACLRRB_01555 [Ruminococcus sp.]
MLVKGGLPLRVRDLLMRSLGLCVLFGISGAISAMVSGWYTPAGERYTTADLLTGDWCSCRRAVTFGRSHGGAGSSSSKYGKKQGR